MKQDLTYSYRLYPNQKQQTQILRIAEAARQYYNEILREKRVAFLETEVWIRKLEAVDKMEDHAKEARVEISVLKYAADDFERAFRYYRWINNTKPDRYKESAKTRAEMFPKYPLTDADLKGMPQEKPWGAARKTFSLSPDLLWFQEDSVYVPDVGWVRAKFHRLPQKDCKIKRCTVLAKSSGKFFLLLEVTVNVEDRRPDHVPDEALGVVFSPGLLAVRSDGVPVAARHSDPEIEKQIERAYKTLQRRTPGSKRYAQQRQKLAKLYEKQTARRRDALHKASADIVGTGKYIGVQVPEVKKLAQKHKKEHADRVVLDEAWYSFYSMLRYKANLGGMPVYPIPRAYPIWKTCAACGAQFKREPKTNAWVCPKCGVLCGKGGNAARNIQHYMENEIRQWRALPQDRGLK